MSTPRLIKILSTSSKSRDNKQTCITQANYDRSSIDTNFSMRRSSQMQNYYPLLVDQIKKLSQDNDRLWGLLTQSDEQHVQCSKVQKKLKQNLECAQKQLSLVKQMYTVQKSNFQQSKIFFEKRQKQWQEIVGNLKNVIQNYDSTQNIDMNKASQIFNQTSQMKTSFIEQLPRFEKDLSIYSRRNGQKPSEINQLSLKSKQISSSQLQQSQIKYKECEINRKNSILSGSRLHRSKLFKSKNLNLSKNLVIESSKKRYDKIYTQEMTQLQYFSCNPEQAYQLLTLQDVFEKAIRRTYINYRNNDGMKTNDILSFDHMKKLQSANSSTKQRLGKTIRKIFSVQSAQQLQDVIKFIEDSVYKRHRLLKGQLVFNFLSEKFKQCEQIYQSSNSALDRFDRQPTKLINGVSINSKYQDFQHKRKQLRSHENKSLRTTQLISVKGLNKDYDMRSIASGHSINLNINSNIKDKKNLTHINNHMRSQTKIYSQQIDQTQRQRKDHSQKNIYTEKRLQRKKFVQNSNSKSYKSISIENLQHSSYENQNLSSIIRAITNKNQDQYRILVKGAQNQKYSRNYNKNY